MAKSKQEMKQEMKQVLGIRDETARMKVTRRRWRSCGGTVAPLES